MATVRRKNSFLRERNFWKNQNQAGVATCHDWLWVRGGRQEMYSTLFEMLFVLGIVTVKLFFMLEVLV